MKHLPRVFSFRLAIVGPDHVELQLVTDLEFEKETKTARYALEFAEQGIGGDVTIWGDWKSSSTRSSSLKMQLGRPKAIQRKGAVGKCSFVSRCDRWEGEQGRGSRARKGKERRSGKKGDERDSCSAVLVNRLTTRSGTLTTGLALPPSLSPQNDSAGCRGFSASRRG